eukprot:CAMPEP_0172759448 /NCGR_PEP_ID=MMETSP1074-20121228/167768_1 /TAXON_ID=2916 /ORGANISM="Ceratium fusus, Strain PA161109" /LENGTH=252 /DNA_ID=CAMNT_0013593243 /DNA_START=37 /DNA_END=792 /DNA_ORIENTATION=-
MVEHPSSSSSNQSAPDCLVMDRAGDGCKLTARLSCLAESAVAHEKLYRKNLKDATHLVREALERPEAEVVRLGSVDSRLIFVIDGALAEEAWQDLLEFLSVAPFRRTNFARPENREFTHYLCEHALEDVADTAVYRTVLRLAQVLFPESAPLVCHRAYTNARYFGDVGFQHRDSDRRSCVTGLVYPNASWAPELGGETIFYDEAGHAVESCEPRPGRIAIFNGSILHRGSPPGRLFVGARYTTAFKMDRFDD